MDAAEFDQLYATGFGRLVGQLYALTGDREEARECVQEAFLRAWARRSHLDADLGPEAWVRTTAYRLAVSRWRRWRRGQRPWDRALQVLPAASVPNGDRVDIVAALSCLPMEQRRALVLHHVCDLSVEQVAAETGAPVGTVKARLSRGRKALAAVLGDSRDSFVEGTR